MEILEWCYSNNYTTFEEWFELLKTRQEVYPNHRIPYQEWLDEYKNDIKNRSEKEVMELLRCLLSPFTRLIDIDNYKSMRFLEDVDRKDGLSDNMKKVLEDSSKIEEYNRLKNKLDAWEGLTWVLQLLPYYPYKAIKALNMYLDSELSYIPDDRIMGIYQCIDIIESKFIYSNLDLENYILDLKPREFELLIANLYEELGYETEVTPATRDGGKDIIGRIKREEGKDIVYAECKLYRTTDLKLETVRAFGYTILKDNVNRGVLFCTGYVNSKIREMDSRIQILSLEEIIILLNAHLGSNWYKMLPAIINRKL